MKGRLNTHQLDRLSEFSSNLGLVFLASVITPLFTGLDKASPFIVGLGLILTSGCLAVSLLLLKGVEK